MRWLQFTANTQTSWGILEADRVFAVSGGLSAFLAVAAGAFGAHALRSRLSPDLLTGVDCRLPSNSGRQVRGAGTVVSRAIITGRRILQGSAYTKITSGRENRRLPWSHYLSQPGQIEAVGKAD